MASASGTKKHVEEDIDIIERNARESNLRKKDESLELALDAGNMGAWEWIVETGKLHWSRQFDHIKGLRPGEFDGTLDAFLNLIHPEDVESVTREIKEVWTRRKDKLYAVHRIMRSDGGIAWLESRGKPVYNGYGKIEKIVGVCLDITERKLAENRQIFLANASRTLSYSLDESDTLQSLASLIVSDIADLCSFDLINDDGRPVRIVLKLSKSLPKVAGAELDNFSFIKKFQSKAIAGKPYICPYVSDDNIKSWVRTEEEYQGLKKLNLTSLISLPMMARKKKVVGVLTLGVSSSRQPFSSDDLSFAADLADRAAVAVDNSRLYQRILSADQAKGYFLSVLSHELRNPLAPIKMSVDVLKMFSNENQAYTESLSMIERQVGHMTTLLDDLLEVSRIKHGRIALRKQLIDVRKTASHAAETFKAMFSTKINNLAVHLPEEPLIINGDPLRLEQVVVNLLTNAGKYTNDGGRIELSVRRENKDALVIVKDDGVGISGDILAGIFRQGIKADKIAISRALGGLGVGLQLVKSLTEAHGGTVAAESEGLGKGSKFTVRLPIEENVRPESVALAFDGLPNIDSTTAEVKLPPGTFENSGARSRVLIIDDNIDAAYSLKVALASLGFETDAVYEGPSAIRRFGSMRPDIVLLDIGMPGMDGYEIARRLKESNVKTKIKFKLVALTGYSQERDKELIKNSGFNYHLVKPISLFALNTLLRNMSDELKGS